VRAYERTGNGGRFGAFEIAGDDAAAGAAALDLCEVDALFAGKFPGEWRAENLGGGG